MHVQARDAAGNESAVKSVSAILDNTIPTLSGVSGTGAIYKSGDTVDITATFSEAVVVSNNGGSNHPRLTLTVGTSTKYADYEGSEGDSSATHVFRYTVVLDDSDSNGIAVTAIDFQGGTLEDAAGNAISAVLGTALNLGSVLVDGVKPLVTGLSDGGTVASQTWTWDCTDASLPCTYRHVVNEVSAHSFLAGDSWGDVKTASQNSDGTYYLHVQARDAAGNESDVESVSVTISSGDTTSPTLSSVTGAGATYDSEEIVVLTATFDEAVVLSPSAESADYPRLVLDVGGAAKHAVYTGNGASSTTHTFSYEIKTGESDGDGIQVTSLDLQGGTVKDIADNGLNTLAGALNVVGVVVNGLRPTVTGLSNDETPRINKAWSWGCTTFASVGCEYRALTNTSPTHIFAVGGSNLDWRGGYTTLRLADIRLHGTYYLHVQAREISGSSRRESLVKSVSTVLDNTVPSLVSIEWINGSYKSGDTVELTATFDEDVVVSTNGGSNRPRISFFWGSAVRYFDYAGADGASSDTVIFSYTVPQVSSSDVLILATFDINGGGIKDAFAREAEGIRGWRRARLEGLELDTVAPSVTGLSSDARPTVSVTWTWTCDDSPCTYRHVVNTESSHTFGTGAWVGTGTVTASQTSGTGTYHLHVQAKDAAGNESAVKSVSAILDSTLPTLPTLDGVTGTGRTYKLGDAVDITATFSEAVVVSNNGGLNHPRLTLTVGTDTAKYAVYQGSDGDSSATHVFRYTVASNDSDDDGIVVTAIDFQGGTLKNAGANGVSALGSDLDIGNVRVDGVVPSVTELSNDLVSKASKTWTWGCSESLCTYRHVVNQDSSYILNSGAFGAGTTATQATGTGTYYLHVQARDAAGNESAVKSVSAILAPADTTPPEITGLSDDSTPKSNITWTWGCTDASPPCEYRLVVNTTSTHAFSTERWASHVTLTRSLGIGTYYLHVQARDAVGNESVVKSVSAILDTTIPTLSGVSGTGATYKSGDTVDITATFNEAVVVSSDEGSNHPRLTLTVGADTKYAVYQGSEGDSSATHVFRYTVVLGDSDSNGIAVTAIDLQGGSINDLAGNDVDAVGAALDLGSVLVDGEAPSVTGLSDDLVSKASKTWTWGCSESPCTYRHVVNQDSSYILNSGAFGAGTTATQATGTGTYYLHVQSRDAVGNESVVKSVSAILDNTIPTLSGVSGTGATYKPGDTVDITATFSEAVVVSDGVGSNHPRLTLTVGVETAKYAVYQGSEGDSSTTHVFRYTVVLNDSDSDGIAVTAIDLQGGTLKDAAGNDVGAVGTALDLESVLVDGVAPSVTGLDNDPTPKASKTWNWDCTDASLLCEYRHVVNAISSHSFQPGVSWGAVTTASQYVDGTYYLHVQARDAAGNESVVKSVSVTISGGDTTSPTLSSVTGPGKTYDSEETLVLTATFDEDVVVSPSTGSTNYPRLTLTVGANTRYAVYTGDGALSATHTFSYEIGIGENDSDGIQVTAVDLQGGSVEDAAGNGFNTVITTLNLGDVLVDGVRPTVTGLSNDETPRKIKTWNWGCTTSDSSSCTYRRIVNTSPTHTFTNIWGGDTTHTTEVAQEANGTYYLHVQVRDASNRESLVKTVSVVLDNTGPTLVSLTGRAGNYKLGDNVELIVTLSEPVRVVNLSSSSKVTLGTRSGLEPPAYEGDGELSATISFFFTVPLNFVGSPVVRNISLNGGTIKDVVGQAWDGAISFRQPAGVQLDGELPTIRGPIGNSHPRKSQTWTWTCTDLSPPCETRYVLNTASRHTFGAELWNTEGEKILNSVTGIYYLHVQGRDSFGNKSAVTSFSANLDNTPPSLSGVVGTARIYKPGEHLDLTATFSEEVIILNTSGFNKPRLTLDVGGITRYAELVGTHGDLAITRTFRYTVLSDDNDSDGIAVTGIDLRVENLKDRAGNIAVSAVLGTALELALLKVDGVRPLVTGLASESTSKVSVTWNWACTDASLPCEYRYKVNTASTDSFSNSDSWSSTATAFQSEVVGTRYLHVQARDAVGHESLVKSVSAVLDNTGAPTTPVLTSLSSNPGADSTPQFSVASVTTGDTLKFYKTNDCSGTAFVDRAVSVDPELVTTDDLGGDGDYYFSVKVVTMANKESACPSIAYTLDSTRALRAALSGGDHSCALFSNDRLKCWGDNAYGQLGRGDMTNLGAGTGDLDNFAFVDLGTGDLDNFAFVDLGTVDGEPVTVKQVAGGLQYACAIVDNKLKCWGEENTFGQLGLGLSANDHRGDGANEMGDSLSFVDLGTVDGAPFTVKQVAVGGGFSCAVLSNDRVKCWGKGSSGQLGLGSTDHKGSGANEMGNGLPFVDLGTLVDGAPVTVKQVALGGAHACAILGNNRVKCWGKGSSGELGLGSADFKGDQSGEMGNGLGFVDLGTVDGSATGTHFTVKQIALGEAHTCALLGNNGVKCWGSNDSGKLGQESETSIGDEPDEMGNNLPPIDFAEGFLGGTLPTPGE